MSEHVNNPKTMWHPSFVSSLQIELREYYESLNYISEVNLNNAPRRIDAVVIVLLKEITFKKNIAMIFRKHNIFEYKSPDDNLTVNDYYNGLSYAFQYKSIDDNKVSIDSLTLSFVCMRKPEKLFTHLIVQQHGIRNGDKGIYYIDGNQIPIQIIVSNELDKRENMFLYGLRKDLDKDMMIRLIQSKSNLPNEIYANYMEAIATANLRRIMEVNQMNAAMLKEIYTEEELIDLYETALETMKILGINKKWDKTLKERLRDNEEAIQKERRAKEEALQKERHAKEENEILRNRIIELERLAQQKQ